MKKIDLQDVLLVLGVTSVVGGVYAWSHPAAAVIFGFFCLAGVRGAGRASAPRERRPEGKN
jgi:hypothetical protein